MHAFCIILKALTSLFAGDSTGSDGRYYHASLSKLAFSADRHPLILPCHVELVSIEHEHVVYSLDRMQRQVTLALIALLAPSEEIYFPSRQYKPLLRTALEAVVAVVAAAAVAAGHLQQSLGPDLNY
mmetsp:Transcript_26741/g.68737  ORF Transcript_26741/g.68737 Transcript_26741/m.68737 type:complete len:127 (-) Transcript_26741:368-748(-)